MTAPQEKQFTVQNRIARHNYEVKGTLRAGLALEGWEVKAALAGHANFQGSAAFVRFKGTEAWLEGLTIQPLPGTGMGLLSSQDTTRSKKLLLTKAELVKLGKKVREQGITVVPLALVKGRYFKVDLALGKGKTKGDKRESVKTADIKRQIDQAKKSLLRN